MKKAKVKIKEGKKEQVVLSHILKSEIDELDTKVAYFEANKGNLSEKLRVFLEILLPYVDIVIRKKRVYLHLIEEALSGI